MNSRQQNTGACPPKSNEVPADLRARLKNVFHAEAGYTPSGWYHFFCPGCGSFVETRFNAQETCGKPECDLRLLTLHLPEVRIRQLEMAVRKGFAANRSRLLRDIIGTALDVMQDWAPVVELPAALEGLVEITPQKKRKYTPRVLAHERRQQILQVVQQTPNGMTAQEVARHIDVSVQLASRYLSELAEGKQVRVRLNKRQGRGRPWVNIFYTTQTCGNALGWHHVPPGDIAG